MTSTLPKLADIEYAREIAWTAVGKDPSEDLCIDDQESLASVFLELSDFVAELHRLAVDPDSRAADFYQDVTTQLDRAGIKEGWAGFEPFEDGDGAGSDLPSWVAEGSTLIYAAPDGSPLWYPEDSHRAVEEGWDLFEPSGSMCIHDAIEIERDDDAKIFEADDDAWNHVLAKANEGSDLHRRAVMVVHLSNDEPGSCLLEYARDNDIPWPLDEATESTETNAT